ncbi:MAG: SGNH/GDSL hydrolase family protein [Microscillaceae bacterium]|nr:SGNH/GDSL hydrolase family protein [Microscillaceae bacterium]
MSRFTLQVSLIGYWLLAISSMMMFKSSSRELTYKHRGNVKTPEIQAVFNSPKIVILGSSTAAGSGAWPYSQSWAGLFQTWLQNRVSTFQLTNLGVGGYSTYNVIATGNPNNNITKALSLDPDIILVNLPSNNVAGSIPLETTISHYYQLKQAADQAGVLIYFTTTQPRNFTDAESAKRNQLQTETIRIRQEFDSLVIDIYDELTDFNNDLRIKSIYNAGDGIHLNNLGHSYIYSKVVEKMSPLISAVPPAQAVKSFQLINAQNDQVITTLQNGGIITLNEMPTTQFNIEAITDPNPVGSIRWQLTGPRSQSILENLPRYALFGNNGSDFYGQTLPTGSYTLTATPYSLSAGQGTAGSALSIQFQVVQSQATQAGLNIYLVNALSNQDIQEIQEGNVIDLSKLSTNQLNIRSTLSQGTAGSLSFQLTGAAPTSRIESTAPYALFGDVAGNFNDWTAVNGNYQLTVLAYSGASASGSLLQSKTVNFSIITQNTPPAPPPVGVSVESLILINAQNNQVIQFLQNGNVLNLAQLPTQSFNVSANTTGAVQRVAFNLDNLYIRSESTAPYALFGDVGGVYSGQGFALGTHNLTVTPYDQTGVAGTPMSINFEVISGAGAKVAKDETSISAYPNPNPGEGIRIANFAKNDPPVEVMIYNTLQKEILREQIQAGKLEEVYIHLPKGLMPGTYYMVVRSSKNAQILPIILRR